MNQARAAMILGGGVVFACAVLMAGETSGWLVALAGLFFVIGGALLTSVVSVGYEPVEAVIHSLGGVFAAPQARPKDDERVLLQVAELYRRGSVRRAEMQIKTIADPFLRQGAQLIIDRCSRAELDRALLWRIANAKEGVKRRMSILHGLAGYAPAFGMLGTLLGLVRLLFGLGDSGLDVVGATMGFAMITTVYGLVAANLVIKPLATKMEQQSREQLAWQHVKYELLLMMFKGEHPALMQESLELFMTSEQGRKARTAPSPVALVQA